MPAAIQVNLVSYFMRHFTEIKLEGRPAVRRKFKSFITRLTTFVLITLTIPVVILVRFARPLVWIRFGAIRSDVIGNSVQNMEYYLSAKELEKHTMRDCFYFRDVPANEQWALMIRRTVHVRPIFRYFDQANKILPGGDIHVVQTIPEDAHAHDIKKIILRREGAQLPFTEEENIQGKKFLQEIGFRKGDKFVCLVVRDASYKENVQKEMNIDWSHHNYRDSDIDTYGQAALALVEKGYWIFRMGKGTHKPFLVGHSRVFDYANSNHSNDCLDLWLTANCRFMISSGTGLDTVAFVYRRPTVFVNFIALGAFNSRWNVLITPKHLSWKNNGKMLSAEEYLNHHFYRSEEFDQAGIVIENMTAIEIQDTVLEMESRLSGTRDDTFADIELQNRFRDRLRKWDRYDEFHGEICPESRIGATFLRNHPEWLRDKTVNS